MTHRVKHGVTFGKTAAIAVLHIVVGQVFAKWGVDCIVTSGTDGTHRTGSLHYFGLAFDFRTRTVPASSRAGLRDEIAKRLGSNYDVVLESDHLHVEYDPKGDGNPVT